MLAVDENGNLVDGDQIMAICGNYMKEKGTLKKIKTEEHPLFELLTVLPENFYDQLYIGLNYYCRHYR